jgi:hypothetical protein
VNAGNTVAQGDDSADFVHGNLGFVVLDLLPDQLRDLVCFDLWHKVSSWLLAPGSYLFLASLRLFVNFWAFVAA